MLRIQMNIKSSFWKLKFVNLSLVLIAAGILLSRAPSTSAYSSCASESDIQPRNSLTAAWSLPPCVQPLEALARDGPIHEGIEKDSTYFSNSTLPLWFNPELAAIGQKFAQKNAAGIYYGAFLVAIFFFANTDIRRVVVDTGKSHEPEKAFRRYLTNFMHAQIWFYDDITLDFQKLNILESLNGVRARHESAMYRSNEHRNKLRKPLIPEPVNGENPNGIDIRIWNAFEKDLKASRFVKFRKPLKRIDKEGHAIKFNQFAMSVGHFPHVGAPVMAPDKVLIPDATEKELLGFLHLGAFIGKAVGVQDEFNICLQPDVETAQKYFREYVELYLVPSLFHLDYETKVMFEAIFKGLNNAFSRVQNDRITSLPSTVEFFLLGLLEDILEVPSTHLRAALTLRERLAVSAFKMLRRPENYVRARPYLNRLARGLFGVWSRVKFGIDAYNSTVVAEKAFV